MKTSLPKLVPFPPGGKVLESNGTIFQMNTVKAEKPSCGMYIAGNTIFHPPKPVRKIEVAKPPDSIPPCPRRPLVCVLCSCGDAPKAKVGHITQAVYSSDDDEDLERESSDTDSEDDGFCLDKLLKSCGVYQQKHFVKKNTGALKNLAVMYHCQDNVEDGQVEQILSMIGHKDDGIKEVGLIILATLSNRETNAFKFLYHNIMTTLLDILEKETGGMEVQEAAALAIGEVGAHTALEDLWVETMMTSGLDVLLDRMGAGNAPAVRLACGQALTALAMHRNLALLIIDHAMPTVLEFKDMNSDFKEVYTSVLTRLVEHTDHTRASVLDVDALPTASHMLIHGPCCVQVQALVLFAALADTDQGLQAMLEGLLVPLVMSALIDSHCRKVRQHAVATIARLVSTRRSSFQKQILVQVDKFYHDHEETSAQQPNPSGNSGQFRIDTSSRINRGLHDLLETVVAKLKKEARMELKKKSNILQVHLTPGIDMDPTCLATIGHLVSTLTGFICLKINKVIKFRNVDLKTLDHRELKEIIRQSIGCVNPVIMNQMLTSGALCVFDLLHVYTTKLQQVLKLPPTLPRGIAVDCHKVNSILQAWSEVQLLTNDFAVKNYNFSLDISTVFDHNEIVLIKKMLGFAHICAKCSCTINYNSLEGEVQDKILSFENSTKSRIPQQVLVNENVACISERKVADSQTNDCYEKMIRTETSLHSNDNKETAGILDEVQGVNSGAEVVEVGPCADAGVPNSPQKPDLPPELQWIMQIEQVQNDTPVENVSRREVQCQPKSPDTTYTNATTKLSCDSEKHRTFQDHSIPTSKLTVAVMISDTGRVYQKELDEELGGQRRVVRMRLYEAGIIETVAPWIMSSDSSIRDNVLSVLDCLVQQLEEKVMPSPPRNSAGARKGARPGSAIMPHDRDHALDLALQHMSERMAGLIEEALGPRPGNINETSELAPPSSSTLDASNASKISSINPDNITGQKSQDNSRIELSEDLGYVDEVAERDVYLKSVSSDPRIKHTMAHGDYDQFARTADATVQHRNTRPQSAKVGLTMEGNGPRVAWSRPQSAKVLARTRSGSNCGLQGSESRTVLAPIKSKSMQDLRRPQSGSESKPKQRPSSGVASVTSGTGSLRSVPRSWSARSWRSSRARPGSGKSVSSLSSVSTVGKAKKVLNEIVKEWSLLPWKPCLDPHQQVALQCQMRVLEVAGIGLVKGLLAPDKEVRRHVLLFLHHIITVSNSDVHMKLSEFGLMPQLVDFLRVNEDDQLLEIIGLMLSRLLVSSDTRLHQLFTKHGGPQLLMAMANYSCGLLRQEVSTTLRTVTRANSKGRKGRIMSAPAERRNRPPDVWDHIQSRWETEDRVMFMLRKWTE